MPFLILKFAHVAFMFMATALAVGTPIVLLLIARTGDASLIQRGFGAAGAAFRAASSLYGLGIVLGVSTALAAGYDLGAGWLVISYVLVAALAGANMAFARWADRLALTVEGPRPGGAPELRALARSPIPLVSLATKVALTLVIVFVMVVKPDVLA